MKQKCIGKRVYRIRTKVGGLEVWVRYPLSDNVYRSVPDGLSIKMVGIVGGKRRSYRVEMPSEAIPKILQIKEHMDTPTTSGRVYAVQGMDERGRWWNFAVYLHSLEESVKKPWEFRLFVAEGMREQIISDPLCIRLSAQTMRNILIAVERAWMGEVTLCD